MTTTAEDTYFLSIQNRLVKVLLGGRRTEDCLRELPGCVTCAVQLTFTPLIPALAT